MDTYYTNTTNATCKTNLVVRKHTLDSRIQEIKDELMKRATKLVSFVLFNTNLVALLFNTN